MPLVLKPRKSDAHTPIGQAMFGIERLLAHYPHLKKKRIRILEPSAGRGNIIEAIRNTNKLKRNKIVAVELRNQYRNRLDTLADTVYCPQDFLEWAKSEHGKFHLIIGNPPYGKNIEGKFVKTALSLLKPNGVLFFLLKLSFAEGVNRFEEIFKKIQPHGMSILSRRIKFYANGGGDRYSYCWFAFCKNATTPQWLEIVNNLPIQKPLRLNVGR